ncbi:hypothetical protein PTI98_012842 [Pleurotus ostreatus]|nr:hypothetical protein PTI98_012842 [Pleurotus ostreatus]
MSWQSMKILIGKIHVKHVNKTSLTRRDGLAKPDHMPRKSQNSLQRAKNLINGLKRLAEGLSPKKKSKKRRYEEEDKENQEPPRAPSRASSIIIAQNPEEEDVFSSSNPCHGGTCIGSRSLFHQCPHFQSFQLEGPFEEPTKAPEISYHLLSVEQRQWQVTIEEVPDEDDDIVSVSDHDATSVRAFPIEQVSRALPEDPVSGSQPASQRNESGPSPEYITRMVECAKQPGFRRQAPAIADALEALKDMRAKLRGVSRGKSGGYKAPLIDAFTRHRMNGMCSLLSLYTDGRSLTYNNWGASSLQAAVALQRGRFCSRRLRELCRAYIQDRVMLPFNPYGDWNESMLADEDLVNDICLHLQELGKDITARKLVTYLAQPDVMAKHGITRPISERTAMASNTWLPLWLCQARSVRRWTRASGCSVVSAEQVLA